MAGEAKDMIAKAQRTIGLGENPSGSNHNYITEWYGFDGPWCDMGVSYWAYHTGNDKAVCPRGKRAYTVWHAEDGERAGLWHSGTADNIAKYAKPGAIVFFDWAGSNSISTIDHVGIVEKNLGDGRIQTIECNTSDKCLRRVRGPGVIAGFFNPVYKQSAPKPAPKPRPKSKLKVPDGSPVLRLGSVGTDVHKLQQCANATLKAGLATDGIYGPLTRAAVLKLQAKYKLVKDGEYGPKSAAAMRKAVAAL